MAFPVEQIPHKQLNMKPASQTTGKSREQDLAGNEVD